MEFRIVVTASNKNYRLAVKRHELSTPDLERFEVRANNHIFVLDCNHPVLLKAGQSHLPWTWNQVAGPVDAKWFVDEIKMQIEKHIRGLDYEQSKAFNLR